MPWVLPPLLRACDHVLVVDNGSTDGTPEVTAETATTAGLADKLSQFTDAWSPKIVGEINEMHVKVVKLRGEFVWHHHDSEDELFLVVAGRLRMRLRTGDPIVSAPPAACCRARSRALSAPPTGGTRTTRGRVHRR